MDITGMDQFQNICRERLLEWYRVNRPERPITIEDTYVVWSCKTLQNYKLLASTSVSGDGIYAEYTFNGDKNELYEDVYGKISNKRYFFGCNESVPED